MKLTPVVHYAAAYDAPTSVIRIKLAAALVDGLGKNADDLIRYTISTAPTVRYILDAAGNPLEPHPAQTFKRMP